MEMFEIEFGGRVYYAFGTVEISHDVASGKCIHCGNECSDTINVHNYSVESILDTYTSTDIKNNTEIYTKLKKQAEVEYKQDYSSEPVLKCHVCALKEYEADDDPVYEPEHYLS